MDFPARKLPDPSSPSFIADNFLKIDCELPEDTLFGATATATVFDAQAFGIGKKTLGNYVINLSEHLPWIVANQKRRSRVMVDQMIAIQVAFAAAAETVGQRPNSNLSAAANLEPELHVALAPNGDEAWEDMSPGKAEVERARYALFISEQSLDGFRALADPAMERSGGAGDEDQKQLVIQGLVQCENMALAALKLVEVELKSNPATPGQNMDYFWHVEERESEAIHDHGLRDFQPKVLDIASTAVDDDNGTADDDDQRDFDRCTLLIEQLVMKLCTFVCERLAMAESSLLEDELTLMTSAQVTPNTDLSTLARKCDAYSKCLIESAAAFAVTNKRMGRHAKLCRMMAVGYAEQCTLFAKMLHDNHPIKLKAIQGLADAFDTKMKALEVPVAFAGTEATKPTSQEKAKRGCCRKLNSCCCPDEASEYSQLAELETTVGLPGIDQELLDVQYNLPIWMLNRTVRELH